MFADLTRARIQALIDSGWVTVDGSPAKASRRLKGGERVDVIVPLAAPAIAVAQDLPLEILYQDRDLAVVDKPAGMVVHPAAGHAEGTLVNALLHRIRDLAGVGGELRPGIVHRLDKDTSGCLVVAKNDQALAALQAQFKSREVKKIYLALVRGQPPRQAVLETLFGRHPRDRKRFTGKVVLGKRAITQFEVMEQYPGAALLEVEIRTGRTHQIRVHLAESGHSILGDSLYGSSRRAASGAVGAVERELGRHALHAWKLRFAHPRSRAPMAFEAPVPADFERALATLRAAPPAAKTRPGDYRRGR